jgi:hypothetical protein
VDASPPEDPGIDALLLDGEGPELLFGKNNNATKDELLAAMPARAVVDRLMSKFFNSMDMAPGDYTSCPLQPFQYLDS